MAAAAAALPLTAEMKVALMAVCLGDVKAYSSLCTEWETDPASAVVSVALGTTPLATALAASANHAERKVHGQRLRHLSATYPDIAAVHSLSTKRLAGRVVVHALCRQLAATTAEVLALRRQLDDARALVQSPLPASPPPLTPPTPATQSPPSSPFKLD